MSPSSRRAWIEIQTGGWDDTSRQVALLAEGVDRNSCIRSGSDVGRLSPSSRRAWIEMLNSPFVTQWCHQVALLAEGVDRNYISSARNP